MDFKMIIEYYKTFFKNPFVYIGVIACGIAICLSEPGVHEISDTCKLFVFAGMASFIVAHCSTAYKLLPKNPTVDELIEKLEELDVQEKGD